MPIQQTIKASTKNQYERNGFEIDAKAHAKTNNKINMIKRNETINTNINTTNRNDHSIRKIDGTESIRKQNTKKAVRKSMSQKTRRVINN